MATNFSILVWRIPVDRGAWEATVHGIAKSRTRLLYSEAPQPATFLFLFYKPSGPSYEGLGQPKPFSQETLDLSFSSFSLLRVAFCPTRQ